MAKPQRPCIEAPEATTPQAKAHIGGNQVIGLNSSVTVARDGRGMDGFYIGPFFVSIEVDTMCCSI
jgi:hypothetical protein